MNFIFVHDTIQPFYNLQNDRMCFIKEVANKTTSETPPPFFTENFILKNLSQYKLDFKDSIMGFL